MGGYPSARPLSGRFSGNPADDGKL